MSSANKVIPLGNITRFDLPPDRVLEGAKGKMEGVVLIGWDKDGDFYGASSYADGGDVLWLLEQCKRMLLSMGDEE